tara:strand:- start:1587 stop:2225 length:639 start_codon:yes stop_codon:yes gene_type:complete
MKKKLESIRVEYNSKEIKQKNLLHNPFDQLKLWINEAIDFKIKDANAVVLSTFDELNGIKSRVVLIKQITKDGLIFYTNYNSLKAHQISNNNKASLCFFWSDLERQVRINGAVKKISKSDSDSYWKLRPRDSKISAIFSKQSQEISNNFNLKKEFEVFKKKFKDEDISRPENWGGYIVIPKYFEFWNGKKNRQHDRFVYTKEDKWLIRRLFP